MTLGAGPDTEKADPDTEAKSASRADGEAKAGPDAEAKSASRADGEAKADSQTDGEKAPAAPRTGTSRPGTSRPGTSRPGTPLTGALRALWAVLLACALVGLSFMVVLLPPVTHLLAERTVNDLFDGPTHEQLVALADEGRAYVTFGAGELPVGSDERVAFTPEVISHLDDVRLVLRAAIFVTLALMLAVVALFVVLRRRGLTAEGFAPVCIAAGACPLAAVAVLGLIGLVNFDALFTALHSLFFAEGSWTFAADSLLIRTYPLAFWMGMGIIWALSLVFFSVLTLTIGVKLRTRRSEDAGA
jgi:integral membrane protein (TIGR01906 family)